MICKGAEVRGLFIFVQDQVAYFYCIFALKNCFQSPVLGNTTWASKLWKSNVFTWDFKLFSAGSVQNKYNVKGNQFSLLYNLPVACGTTCVCGAAASVRLPPLLLHSWSLDARCSKVLSYYLALGVEKERKELLLPGSIFVSSLPVLTTVFRVLLSGTFYSSPYDIVLTRQHAAPINTFLPLCTNVHSSQHFIKHDKDMQVTSCLMFHHHKKLLWKGTVLSFPIPSRTLPPLWRPPPASAFTWPR